MPETEVTRDQLLASVHALEPGDLLVIRVPEDFGHAQVEALADQIRDGLGPSIRLLLLNDRFTVQVVHKTDTISEAVRLATANPGQVFEADPGATS